MSGAAGLPKPSLFQLLLYLAVLSGIYFFVIGDKYTDPLVSTSIFTSHSWMLVFLVFLLMPFNLLLETEKWRTIISMEGNVSRKSAFLSVISGSFFGLITPGRAGDLPGRITALPGKRKQNLIHGIHGSLAQLLITVFIGFVAILFFILKTDFIPEFVGLSLLFIAFLAIVFFTFVYLESSLLRMFPKWLIRKTRLENLPPIQKGIRMKLLILSFLRYIVFSIQFFISLHIFDLVLTPLVAFSAIALVYFLTAAVPVMILGELGIRETAAGFVFGMIAPDWSAAVLASLLIWFINLLIPAIPGAWIFLTKSRRWSG